MNMQRIRIFFTHLYYLGHKELLAILKDPRMRLALIMPVFTQGLLFGYVANYNLDSVPYAVVDASRSEASQSLLAHFDGLISEQEMAEMNDAVESGGEEPRVVARRFLEEKGVLR